MILLIPIIAGLGLMSFLGIPVLETGLAFIFTALAWLLNIILTPFDMLIAATMPSLGDGLVAINNMLDIAKTYMAYILDASLIPQTAITLVVSYYVFVAAVSISAWSIKLVIKWRQALLS